MFEISKETIPVPSRNRRGGNYPLAAMQVGQHFDAPRDMGRCSDGGDRRQSSISSAARSYAKRHNPDAEFTVRIVDENTVRCWRIA